MRLITITDQQTVRLVYNLHFEGKNRGCWDLGKMPSLPVPFSLCQYINDDLNICDVLRFDGLVTLEGRRRSCHSYYLSKHKPNHRCLEWYRDISSETTRVCKSCGLRLPVDAINWTSTRKCINCYSDRHTRFKTWCKNYKGKDQFANLGYAKHIGYHNFGIKDESIIESLW